MNPKKVLGVIPARYQSSRFPGKPLAEIADKPMIQWVYERARQARLLSEVIVATDDDRILQVVQDFGGRAEITSRDIRNGTERTAVVARKYDYPI
ncbi:NTP transferase domain-containing protein, partial [candidate division KSB1 bacterium]|nr:NTP transferase domain-containing protein [candidate division KSB1 bacterium]